MKIPQYLGRSFKNETVDLDDTLYDHCTFESCTFKFRGGTVRLTGNTFLGTNRFIFDGPAANTMDLLRGLYSSGGGLRATVESLFAGIRGEADSAQSKFEESTRSPNK